MTPAAAVVAACGGASVAEPVVLTRSDSPNSNFEALVSGAVSLDPDECVRLSGRVVVWPSGTRWRDGALSLPSGDAVPASFEGSGAYVDRAEAEQLLSTVERLELARCLGNQREIAVINPIGD